METITGYMNAPLTVENIEQKQLKASEYHANDGRINATFLKTLASHGLDVAYYQQTAPKTDTPSLRIGRLAHALILENRQDYAAPPEGMNLRTKAGQEWKKDKETLGVEVVSIADGETLEGMRESVLGTDNTANLLAYCSERETSWHFNFQGVPCKARIDLLSAHREIVADLKTVSRLEDFERDYWKFGYDIQADFYRLPFINANMIDGSMTLQQAEEQLNTGNGGGELAPHFAFIIVEKTAPYRTAVYVRESINLMQLADLIQATRTKPTTPDLRERELDITEQPPAYILTARSENIQHAIIAGTQ